MGSYVTVPAADPVIVTETVEPSSYDPTAQSSEVRIGLTDLRTDLERFGFLLRQACPKTDVSFRVFVIVDYFTHYNFSYHKLGLITDIIMPLS